jgi:hypothetical protein
MSFAYLTSSTNARLLDLEARLLQEWRQPQQEAVEPIIIEEREGRGGPPDLYVIWQDWADLSRSDRSKIILNAYEQQYGREASLEIMVANGLTPKEADLMGIEYKPLEPAV